MKIPNRIFDKYLLFSRSKQTDFKRDGSLKCLEYGKHTKRQEDLFVF